MVEWPLQKTNWVYGITDMFIKGEICFNNNFSHNLQKIRVGDLLTNMRMGYIMKVYLDLELK